MIDRRVMNRMDAATKAVHIRLEVWGKWARDNPELRQYPSENVLFKIARQGITGAAQGRTPMAEIPEAIQLTELAVVRLEKLQRNCICAYYLNWAPVQLLARRLVIAERVFEQQLAAGRNNVGVYVKGFQDAMHVSTAVIRETTTA